MPGGPDAGGRHAEARQGRLEFREGTKGVQVAHIVAIRFVAERDDLPGPELWLVIERSCDQAPYVKILG
jgi:hypothetical protein